MSRFRNNVQTETPPDSSLTVATTEDVLFKTYEAGGERFLLLRKLKLEHWRREFGKLKIMALESEEDVKYLRGLEPTAWKDQDHYAVLGLKHLRVRATEDEIKKSYRLRVLKHHPDKRMGAGEQVNPECDYFACIVKAFETLTQKRQAYDSIDPEFDNYSPPKTLSPREDFFTTYGRWFELNSRWSNITPALLLGNSNTPRDKVEDFYTFWYEFDSWREYSYLDEEDKESGSFREERRYIDKQNKAARAKLKKEEMARIRAVVDNSYALDPRIAMFREKDNLAKQEKKLEKQKVARDKQELEDKLRRESEEKARLEKEKQEAEEKEKEQILKREKEAIRKAFKKERKNLRTTCQSNDYYGEDEKSRVDNMAHLESICEILPVDELEKLNKQLSTATLEKGREIFLAKSTEIRRKIEAEKEATTKAAAAARNGVNRHGVNGSEDWNTDELAILIKAVNVFPAGTVQRWEVVANFLCQHQPNGKRRSAKEVLAKAKDLKDSSSLKEMANKKAFSVFEKGLKSNVRVEAAETTRDDEATTTQEKPWNADEQRLLEQALKTFPASHSDRWDLISECVPGRSKKECMIRFKELAALVKAKKLAQKAS